MKRPVLAETAGQMPPPAAEGARGRAGARRSGAWEDWATPAGWLAWAVALAELGARAEALAVEPAAVAEPEACDATTS